MFAYPREVVRIHSSSVRPETDRCVGYTKTILKCGPISVGAYGRAAGVTHDDVVQIAFGYGMFTGAFGLHYGSERLRGP